MTRYIVWAAISVSGVIGPYFFHRAGCNITVNQTPDRNVLNGSSIN